MSSEEFIPNHQEACLADEAYIHYLAGIAMLHDPEDTRPVHGFSLENIKTAPQPFIRQAGQLMVAGLQGVIRFANPIEQRSRLSLLESGYGAALPHMMASVKRVLTEQKDRLNLLGSDSIPAIMLLKPAPMHDKTVYTQLCHSRLYKLFLYDLLGGVFPSEHLYSDVESLKLADALKVS